MDSLQMPADMLMGVASLMAKGLSPGDVVPMGQSPGLQAGRRQELWWEGKMSLRPSSRHCQSQYPCLRQWPAAGPGSK
jgi:hypothetical protein